jgi:hypothetical protein
MAHVRLRKLVILLGLAAFGALAVTGGAGAKAQRPMEGSCATTFSGPPTGPFTISGSCWFTHLGPATYEAIQTVVPNADGTVHITVTGTYTAANGDTLNSSVVGTGSFTGPGTVHYETTETYSGGSGRFVDATGEVNDVGDANLATATSSFTSSGWIAY